MAQMTVATPALLQVQLGQLLGLVADRDLAGRRRLDPGTLDERVDDSAEALLEEAVGPLEASGQVAGEGDQLAVGAGQVTGEGHPIGRVPAQVGVMPTAATRQRGHRIEAAAGVGELVGGRQRHAVPGAVADQLDDPAEDVAAAVAPRDSARRSDRDVDAPAGLEELLRQL